MVMLTTMTWAHLALLVGIEHGRVLSDDDIEFILWECTAFPFDTPANTRAQIRKALTEP